MSNKASQLRQQILELSAQYFAEAFPQKDFHPGNAPVPVSGKVIDAADLCSVVDSALDCWFTTGRFAADFERKLARFVGVRSASLVNSGSSANLVAISALTSPKLGDRAAQAWRRGHHRRGGLSNHDKPDHSEPARACFRRYRASYL